MATPRKPKKAMEESFIEDIVESVDSIVEEVKEIPKKLGRIVEQNEYFQAIAQMRNKKK